jgi:hypothetical protein
MRGWFLFAVMVVLIFGPMLLDELSRLRVRRENRARPIVHGPISLVPDVDESDLLPSHSVAPLRKTKEHVG